MIGGEWKPAGGIDKVAFQFGSGCMALSHSRWRHIETRIVSFGSVWGSADTATLWQGRHGGIGESGLFY
jgi:hypothetical protein